MNNEVDNIEQQKLIGVLGQFDDPHTLIQACETLRDSGVNKMDAFTPYPIHGIEKAIGIPRTILPWIVLVIASGGICIGLGMQWYTNATMNLLPFWSGYEFRIGGKPFFSLPANIPVTFEVIVLSSAFAAFLGMLVLNGLPRLANPLHRIPRFKRVTNDKFFLMVGAEDANFNASQLRNNFSDWGATDVEEVFEDQTDWKLPAFLKTFTVLALVMMLVPPALIFRARGMTYTGTRLHVVPDMDWQVKFKTQTEGPLANNNTTTEFFFQDIRAQFADLPGTVSRSDQSGDSEFFKGIRAGSDLHSSHATPAVLASTQEETSPAEKPQTEETETADATAVDEPDWVTTIPSQVKVDRDTVMRGQRQYNIYCAVCHGYSGEGNGLANNRAVALSTSGESAWTEAKSLYDPTVIDQPVGRIYDTITNGRSTMGPYATRIKPEDRWAIVLYVKALQKTRKDALSKATEADSDSDKKDSDKQR